MVGVCKRYAKLSELVKAILEMQKSYVYVRVDYPCEVKDYFAVKGWKRKRG